MPITEGASPIRISLLHGPHQAGIPVELEFLRQLDILSNNNDDDRVVVPRLVGTDFDIPIAYP
jgi:hypothetical protein